ncbi:MAG: acyl-CoA dehydrogenase family protein, partial [Gemmatimonadaceae bacterium]
MARALTPLTEEQRAIQATAREFASRELAPHVDDWDRDAHFEPAIIPKLGELGFLGMMVPEVFDGLGLETLSY